MSINHSHSTYVYMFIAKLFFVSSLSYVTRIFSMLHKLLPVKSSSQKNKDFTNCILHIVYLNAILVKGLIIVSRTIFILDKMWE